MLTSETECRVEIGVQVLDSDVSSCMKHYFVCIIFFSQCIRFNVFLSISAIGCVCCSGSLLFSRGILPLSYSWRTWCGNAGCRGGGGLGGRGGGGIRYVVICWCGGEMYCNAWRLAPKISYIMSVQIILLTGAMLLETTYRRKCHIIG